MCKAYHSSYQKKVCYIYIEETFQADNYDSASISNVKPHAITTGSKYNGIWKKYGCLVLLNLHKAHLCADNWLDDIHIGAAQELIKKQSLHFAGLQTRWCKFRDDKSFPGNNDNLQIVHMKLRKIPYSGKVWWRKVWWIDSFWAFGEKSLAN